jgi:hypothetical protein
MSRRVDFQWLCREGIFMAKGWFGEKIEKIRKG